MIPTPRHSARSCRPLYRRTGHTARAGVTVVEVIVAMIVAAIGVIALASTNTLLIRLVGGGERASRGAFVAQQQLESMRADALTATGCAALANGADTTGIYKLAWTVTTSGAAHSIRLIMTYPVRTGQVRSDTLGTTLTC
ncbi:MAG TPA: hypothetical protein VNW46_08180 [Gemmatimonadaceae bacterium]|jgi:Tfp pilus assembly protein PilV|nr:hypothetical protein [Gemmatimonadaceae bacterium]